jgi:hypothetical protein
MPHKGGRPRTYCTEHGTSNAKARRCRLRKLAGLPALHPYFKSKREHWNRDESARGRHQVQP